MSLPPSSTKLMMLAALWDELAAGQSKQSFRREFSPDLERLNRLRQNPSAGLSATFVSLLERKVMETFRLQFPRSAIQQIRARLNQSN